LRQNIVLGKYAPGHRLPTRLEIGKKFGVGVSTIQKALDSLMDAGFVEVRARAGTFVVEHPPHLSNYGLVMHAEGQWSRYYIALRQAAGVLDTGSDVQFVEYQISKGMEYRRELVHICRDVSNQRLAGLILAGPPEVIQADSILQHSDIPRVYIQRSGELGAPSVLFSEDSFIDRAVKYLGSQGRRRIGHLHMEFPWNQVEQFQGELRKRGIEVPPYLTQGIPVGSLNHTASNVVNLMMQLDDQKRPDALIIYDDNLTSHAIAGLMAAGVKVPDDVMVVVKCNYPLHEESVVPLVRLGLDCRLLLEKALELLDCQHQGMPTPELTELEAKFEDEV